MKTIWIEIYTTRGVKLLGNKSHQFNWIPKCMDHVLVIWLQGVQFESFKLSTFCFKNSVRYSNMHFSKWSTLYYCSFAKLRTLMTIQLSNNQMPFCRQRKFCSKLLVIWIWMAIKIVNSSLSLIAGSFSRSWQFFFLLFLWQILVAGSFKIVLPNDVSRVKVTK